MDISPYVPKDQEVLRDSGLSDSDRQAKDGRFAMRWNTPYAQYLWHGDVMHGNPTNRTYGPDKISFTAALAREEWAKYASQVYGKEWEKVYPGGSEKEAFGDMRPLTEFLSLIAQTAEEKCDLDTKISLKELPAAGGLYAELGEGFGTEIYYDKSTVKTIPVLFLCRHKDQERGMEQLCGDM